MNRKNWDDVSKNYYNEILSPIKDSFESPLLEDVGKVSGKRKAVLDLGCGTGVFEPFLSKKFGKVVALDYSSEMIKTAKRKCGNLSNVTFLNQDIGVLKKFHGKFDVAVSINSFLSENLRQIDKMFNESYRSLKKRGNFFGVFPAMEVYLYQAMLLSDRISKNGVYERIEKLKKMIGEKEHNFLLGLTNFGGYQKNYYRFELVWRLNKAGFKNIEIGKVEYSWKEFKKAGQNYFPSEERPWDWYVRCNR